MSVVHHQTDSGLVFIGKMRTCLNKLRIIQAVLITWKAAAYQISSAWPDAQKCHDPSGLYDRRVSYGLA